MQSDCSKGQVQDKKWHSTTDKCISRIAPNMTKYGAGNRTYKTFNIVTPNYGNKTVTV
jgi:hypothetical protein